MSSDILSKAFTTKRALELEYRKLSIPWEGGIEVELSSGTEESGDRPLIADLACFADATWV